MIASPVGGVAQRRAARKSVGLRPATTIGLQSHPPLPQVPQIPQLSVTVPTEEAFAASSSLRHSVVTDDPISPVTDICVSPSWSDFGGKKRKKEKKARDKIRKELEKERKEQEKRLRKAREQETRTAKAAGQRPPSSQSNGRKTYYVPPISQDSSQSPQPWRTQPIDIAQPFINGGLSTGSPQRSPDQRPQRPQPPRSANSSNLGSNLNSPNHQQRPQPPRSADSSNLNSRLNSPGQYPQLSRSALNSNLNSPNRNVPPPSNHISNFYSPQIKEKLIVDDPPLDSDDEYERDLITHAYHLTLSQSTKGFASPQSKYTNKPAQRPNHDGQTSYSIFPASPMSSKSAESNTTKETPRPRGPSPLPIQSSNYNGRIQDVASSLPHVPPELYSTDGETVSESGNSVIDGSDNFASAEESYDDCVERGEASDSDDYDRSSSRMKSRMAAAVQADLDLLRAASERLRESELEQSRLKNGASFVPGEGHHQLSYAHRQRLDALHPLSSNTSQRWDSQSDYGERTPAQGTNSPSVRSFLLDESPVSGIIANQQDMSIRTDKAEAFTEIGSPRGSIGPEPASYFSRQAVQPKKSYSLEAVNLDTSKAENGFWEDLWPVFSKSGPTSNAMMQGEHRTHVKPRLSSVDYRKPSLESATARELPTASKAEYSTDEGAFEARSANNLRTSRPSKTLSIEVPKRASLENLKQVSTEPQVYEPLTAKKVTQEKALFTNTTFDSTSVHRQSDIASSSRIDSVSPTSSIGRKNAETAGPLPPPSPLSLIPAPSQAPALVAAAPTPAPAPAVIVSPSASVQASPLQRPQQASPLQRPQQASPLQRPQQGPEARPRQTSRRPSAEVLETSDNAQVSEIRDRIPNLSAPDLLRPLPVPKASEHEDLPAGVARQLSVTRTHSSPALRETALPSDLSFLPELRHQALVKPEHSKVSSIDTSRGSASTSGSSFLSGSSRMSSLDIPSPTAPSIRSSSDDGFATPLGTTVLREGGGLKPGPRPQRAVFRPPLVGHRQTMAPPGPSQAGAIIAQQQKPIAKMFVICCKCKFWHDLPSKIYEAMAMPRKILEDKVTGVKTGKVDTVVKCPWCEHGMSSQCCAGWTTVVYLHERHH